MEYQNTETINLIIVGAGGTGGHLYERVTRLAYGMNHDETRPNVKLTLVDGDEVEQKNLIRQNFTIDELGLNKASALSYRYAEQLDVQSDVVQEYLTSPEDVIKLFDQSATMNVIVGAVDNNYARYLIDQAMVEAKDRYNAVWIDSGNRERDGQTIISGSDKALQVDKVKALLPDHKGPKSPFELYPEAFNDFEGTNGDVTQLSCELAAISAPQNISANIIAADLVFMVLNKLFSNEIISVYEYKFDTQSIGIAAKKGA